MPDNRTTELQGILDEFEHECYMLRVEASETRARDDVVRNSYERIRDEFVRRIAAMLEPGECEDVSTQDGRFICSKCGCKVWEDAVDNGMLNYCPDCGLAVNQ